MTTVIDVQNLTKKYKDKLALDHVSLSIEENTIYVCSVATAPARRR